MNTQANEIIRYLRHIGDDFDPDDKEYVTTPECEGQGVDEDSCADHGDCGICRFEYMLRKGWLKEQSK